MSRIGLNIKALDTLFFRDGRPFEAAGHGRGGLPTPRTLAGALRTALLADAGFDFNALARWRRQEPNQGVDQADLESKIADLLTQASSDRTWILSTRFRGPWLALSPDGPTGVVDPLLPVPSILVRGEGESNGSKGSWDRSKPIPPAELPGWPTVGGLWPLFRKRSDPDAKPPGGFLRSAGWKAFLRGDSPGHDQWCSLESVCGYDTRTGIGVDPDALTASEGLIYTVQMLALPDKVSLYAEILLPDDTPAGTREVLEACFSSPFPFGGEGRYASATVLGAAFDWQPEIEAGERSLWMLATPAFFEQNGQSPSDRPKIPEGSWLRAAASPAPLAVSGWDVARNGPRPTRFAVPAGSVYFVEGPFQPDQDSVCNNPEDVAQGWGYALRGVWNT